MATECRTIVHESVEKSFGDGDWILCFQRGTWIYTDRLEEHGYRFIWRRPDGSLQARGAARLPSIKDMLELIAQYHREYGELCSSVVDQQLLMLVDFVGAITIKEEKSNEESSGNNALL